MGDNGGAASSLVTLVQFAVDNRRSGGGRLTSHRNDLAQADLQKFDFEDTAI
jgi:hypothetical protein